MQLDPNQLAALAAVLRRGVFDAAAAELNVTPSAISQRIKALEERIGTTLINRGPPCTATPQGARLAKHAQDISLLEQHLSSDLSLDGHHSTHIRIAVNADSLATWFIPVMSALPDMLFDLVVDDQDHSAEWLKRGEVAAAVTASPSLPGCDSHPLGALRYLATASPDYMAKWMPEGPTPQTLPQAPCLIFNQKDQLQRNWAERYLNFKASPPAHMLPSTQAFVEAAIAGLGWGMNPEVLCRRALRRNRLTCLLPDSPLDVALNWQVSRVLAPALQPLTKAVLNAARSVLIQS
ncbi:MAG: LysR family transcriptional regulator ArgP [Pelagimonas sp.]|jgi:LysR family transcriptional regulator (chromosome initiation inhibitor)|nr:LysR family transcriptional regulator ArgP [Pelagimonas sp.]